VYDPVEEVTKFIVPPRLADLRWFIETGIYDLFESKTTIKFHFSPGDILMLTKFGFCLRNFIDLQKVGSAVVCDVVGAGMRRVASFTGNALGVACKVGRPSQRFPHVGKLVEDFHPKVRYAQNTCCVI
jgi:hypothetical protein